MARLTLRITFDPHKKPELPSDGLHYLSRVVLVSC